MMFVSLGIGAVIAVVLIGLVSILTGGKVTNTSGQSALIGTTIEPFHGTALDGTHLEAPWASGHPTILVFMASWCAPCKAELPGLSTYLREHVSGDVRVVGINYNDAPSSAKALVAKDGFDFPVLPDNGAVTVSDFGFNGLPDTVALNARGVVTYVHVGATSDALLAKELASLR
jgi:thiol-disulfide isomerase/thioredoxin